MILRQLTTASTISSAADAGKHSASEASAMFKVSRGTDSIALAAAPIATGQVCEMVAQISGDVGGLGISRFHFSVIGDTDLSAAEANAAGAALHALYVGSNDYPTDIHVNIEPIVTSYATATGITTGFVTMGTIPATITGTATGNYASGTGARINWKTSTTRGRRLMRGCTFMSPFGQVAYAADGSISGGTAGALTTAAINYLNALNTAGMAAVVWHRPVKPAFVDGAYGVINAVQVTSLVSSLRSRRH